MGLVRPCLLSDDGDNSSCIFDGVLKLGDPFFEQLSRFVIIDNGAVLNVAEGGGVTDDMYIRLELFELSELGRVSLLADGHADSLFSPPMYWPRLDGVLGV